MPSTTALKTELPGLAAAVAEASPEPDDIEYPERSWTAQSVSHGDAVAQAKMALRSHFRDRPDVLVAMELAVYYQRGNNRVWLQPDVQVVFEVSPKDHPSYRIWKEGKAPDFVLEVASPSTADRDAEAKAEEYARIGVKCAAEHFTPIPATTQRSEFGESERHTPSLGQSPTAPPVRESFR